MSQPAERRAEHHERLAALGQPPDGRDTLPEPDFAREHDVTAVDRDVITGEDADEREAESPRGWSGEDC
ncbi:hypothetical protein [Salinispora arenicola]|uniref:Uncharacterized protein n=2 Tax=Salinispora arenicola TaxID=168697 RepID=A0A542XNK8_SALAC|nr:hypothetical protein [Salinispora arenicola]MCN0154108.1 hypothetical protein [Salinispora arenicola]MCN0179666.1 hypothetical protein [Salinispora arenicola]NIL42358.1 hypothetical protein [Salinispora arenicola]NIL58845.1 hypothetical protein [Salinispora arenicola]NIL64261.1 hypothetical protein [Salinispora arenicola]